MMFSLIAAVDSKLGIGKNGKMPWGFALKKDLEHFQKLTAGIGKNAVIMGRTTWESIPENKRPLPKRINIVLTRQKDLKLPNGAKTAESLDDALTLAQNANAEKVFIIGGAQAYTQAIAHPACTGIYLTQILAEFDCDTFFPRIDENRFKITAQSEILEENGLKFRFEEYKKA